MRILSLAPAKPEYTLPSSSVSAVRSRLQTRKPFAILALLILSVLALHPIASMASQRETKKTATTIKLKVSATKIAAGKTLTLTADISPSKATGTVTAKGAFSPSGPFETIKTEPVKKGVATGSEAIPKGISGTIYLKAFYNGSSTYATSSSNVVKVVIEK